MASFIVLLRGVNVGGITIRMADLCRRLSQGDFAAVRTVLASGNVLVETELPSAEVTEQVQQILRESYGYDAWVQVLTPDMLARIERQYPFHTDESTHQPYVVFCRSQEVLEELCADLPPDQPELEQVAPGESCLYWQVPKGQSVHTPVAKLLARARYKADTTTRNLRTVRRLLEGTSPETAQSR